LRLRITSVFFLPPLFFVFAYPPPFLPPPMCRATVSPPTACWWASGGSSLLWMYFFPPSLFFDRRVPGCLPPHTVPLAGSVWFFCPCDRFSHASSFPDFGAPFSGDGLCVFFQDDAPASPSVSKSCLVAGSGSCSPFGTLGAEFDGVLSGEESRFEVV